MKERVFRTTLSGSEFERIQFTNLCKKFIVKNFSDNDVFVSFSKNATESSSIKIPKNFYQVIEFNENDVTANETDTLYCKGTGEIEIQELNFR